MITRSCTIVAIFFYFFLSNIECSANQRSLSLTHIHPKASEGTGGYFFIKKYLISLIPALIIGGVNGTVCALVDRNLPICFPWSWIIFSMLRNELVEEFSSDCKHAKLPYNKSLVEITARITDWFAYLYNYT